MVWYIALLILFGLLFLVAELVLLPGVSVCGILSLACYAGAIYLAFTHLGTTAGIVVIVIIALLSLLTIIFSLRAKTWQRFSLKQNLENTSMPSPEQELKVGDRGTTLSRLAPMGKVIVNGEDYEAKVRNGFLDGGVDVVVVAIEGNVIVVEPK